MFAASPPSPRGALRPFRSLSRDREEAIQNKNDHGFIFMRHYPDAGALGPVGWTAEEDPRPPLRRERPASSEIIREIAMVSEMYMDSPYLVT